MPGTRKKNRGASQARRPALTPRSQRIALNGQYLDEVRTRLHCPTERGSVSYLCLPEEHHHAISDGDGFILRIPAITALQLYHDGLLSAGQAQLVELTIGDRPCGPYFVEWLRREPDHHGVTEMVLLRLVPASGPRADATAGRRWIDELVPLRVESHGMWDPGEEYWGEDDEPIEDWAKPIIERGRRPRFEMEQVLPGSDPDDPDDDPIIESRSATPAVWHRPVASSYVWLSRIRAASMRTLTSETWNSTRMPKRH